MLTLGGFRRSPALRRVVACEPGLAVQGGRRRDVRVPAGGGPRQGKLTEAS